ncbi:DUF3794 domain-containing protein [Clostridium pasteurianum]|uniref:Uncharacterized protein n=1 Tax=Clostridium pasteurianum BC1 TaxID=86416 RepID=R4K783_CLOPA|nr:DUF3794 domain-containing protein [Clostridium pasteurianum]AGK98433.1 hypothetical protein Clopa_3651 [Clostridium pasteurianum BC1]
METDLNPQWVSANDVTTKIEPELIGTATRQELIEREIIFDAPKKDVVLKVINILNEIEIKDIKVAAGNVLVSGYLNSCIMYTTTKRPQGEKNNQEKNNENSNNSEQKNGYVSIQNNKNSENNKNKNKNKEQAKPSCGVVDNSIALDGVVRHTTVWIPFKSFIPALEVQEGDICTVTTSAVLDNLKSLSINPVYEDKDEDEYDEESTISVTRSEEEEQKFIKGIVNKTLIELTIDIKRYPKN